MLKSSGAYFCQTVAEGSPWNRIASTLLSQARQSIEALFKNPNRTDGVISKTRKPIPQQNISTAWGRGLIAQIHASSRGSLTKFAERNRTSELVNAMRQMHGWRGAFRSGVWGQRLSTFAFVGIGVASGAQWHTVDESRSLQDPLFNIMDLFAKRTELKIKAQEPETMLVERCLPEPVDFEVELDLGLTEQDSSEPSFILLDSLNFDDFDFTASDEQLSAQIHETDFVEPTAAAYQCEISYEIPAEERQLLVAQLRNNLIKIDQQHAELNTLRASLAQLNEVMQELVVQQDDSDPSFICIEPSLMDLDVPIYEEAGDLRARLSRSLAVSGQLGSHLRQLKQQLVIQNQQLRSLHETATERPAVVRSAFSKRDACCGPGTVREM